MPDLFTIHRDGVVILGRRYKVYFRRTSGFAVGVDREHRRDCDPAWYARLGVARVIVVCLGRA